jgi:hypothetical protein
MDGRSWGCNTAFESEERLNNDSPTVTPSYVLAAVVIRERSRAWPCSVIVGWDCL